MTNLFRYTHKLIAHRGAGTFAPENTIAAINIGKSFGYSAVEFDVMLTSDNIPILMHDEVIGRTILGSGNVCDFTSAHMLSLDAGKWFQDSIHKNNINFTGEGVPSYESIIKHCKEHNIWMNVELKPCYGYEIQTANVIADMTNLHFHDEIQSNHSIVPLFSSYSVEALMAAKLRAPMIPRALLVDELMDDWKEKLKEIGAVAVHLNEQFITKEIIEEVRNAGYAVMLYTVNEVNRVRECIEWGVDAICTDRLDIVTPLEFYNNATIVIDA